MLRVEDAVIIKLQDEFTEKSQTLLTMLYLPLIKERAFILYNLLVALCKGNATFENHLIIQKLCGFSIELIEKERIVLEKFLLLKTYYNATDNQYMYILLSPKDGNTFLRHELFGRMYVNTLGEQVTKFQKLNFSTSNINRKAFEDISVSMTNILKDDWNEDYESTYLKIKEEINKSDKHVSIIFNYDEFLKGYDFVWPKSKRSKKLLEQVGEVATIYGISAKTMRLLVSKSLNKTNDLDIDALRNKAIASKAKFETSEANTYKWPPVRFLQTKQSGIPVSKSDQETIRILLEDYRMSAEVCNVLIEYVLNTSDQKLVRNYVESIAASWSRAKIDTYEKAIKRIKEPSQKSTAFIPDEVKDEVVMSEEERLKLIEEINAKRGK